MLLQLEWQYLQMTVPGVGTLMGPIEEDLRDKCFPVLSRGGDINAIFQKILGHSVTQGGLGIPDLWLSAESAYNTSKVDSGEVVESLLGGSALNYVGHRACVCKVILAARHANMHVDVGEIAMRKDQAGG